MNKLSLSFHGAFASSDSQTPTSDGSIFNAPIAMPEYTLPVAGNDLSQIPSPVASLDPQLQQLGVGANRDSYEFLNGTNVVGFGRASPKVCGSRRTVRHRLWKS
jgi:hypothetical protein